MISQKGFSLIIILVLVALFGLGFYAGSTSQKPITANASALAQTLVPNIDSTVERFSSIQSSSYDFNVKSGGLQVKVNTKDGNLDEDVLVELRTYNAVNAFNGKTRDQDTKYVNKENAITEFTDVAPGRYKVSVMYGSLWNKSTDVEVISGQTANISITIETANNTNPSLRDGYSSSSDQNTVTISGRFTIPDFNKIWYTFSVPKNGGNITGSMTGACEGTVTGQIQPQDRDNQSTFTGLLEAKCKPMVGFSWKVDMKAYLEGLIDFKSGKSQVIYNFSQPFSLRGSTNINFTP